MRGRAPTDPPAAAEAFLQRLLPPDVRGLSILGDLRQEYEELTRPRSRLGRDVWYWWSAVGLGARYAFGAWRASAFAGEGRRGLVEGLSTVSMEVRFGVRMLIKSPLASSVAVLTIALGVALTTHTFSTVYGTILRGVPVPGQERLVYIGANRLELGISEMEIPIHDFEDLRAQQSSLDDVAAFSQGTVNVAGDEGPPERFAGAHVSANALDVVGVAPLLGRTFRPGEDDAGAAPLVVLGHHVWQNRFAGDPAIVGRSIRVNGETAEIIGVMPEGFRFPFLEDLWLTHRVDRDALQRGFGTDFDVFGKLRDGTTLAAAQAEVSAIAQRLAEAYPESNEGIGMYVAPYEERFMPREIQAVVWLMLAATFGVLLIACTNVANLLMARASVRAREIAVRSALGAGRWRVVRQLLMESVVIAAVGGLVGVWLSAAGVAVLRGAIADIYKPYWIDIRMDVPVLVFSVLVTGLAAVIAGTLPAMRASRLSIGEHIKDEARGTSGMRLGRLSRALMVSEIAVSCALLVGAGFMVRSVVNLRNVDLGFETEGILTGRVGLFEADYPDVGDRDRFFTRLRERLEAEPRVESAALTSALPGLGGARYFFGVEGVDYASDSDYPVVHTTVVSPGFFETFGVRLSSGRGFDEMEARLGGDAVAIVNESFVETHLDDGSALGSRVRLGISSSERPWRTIIGVVPDMHIGGNVGGIGDDLLRPERVFLPQGAIDVSFMSFAVRAQGDPAELAPPMRSLVAELDPNLPVYDLLPLGGAIANATWAFGLFGSLFVIFGIAALFLASVGLYGVMAFGVSQRRKEMGVRLALGAEPPAILAMVLMGGARHLVIGAVIGAGLGALMSRSMRMIFHEVETSDPYVYGTILITLGAVGMLACLLPARAATRTDPVRVMRGE